MSLVYNPCASAKKNNSSFFHIPLYAIIDQPKDRLTIFFCLLHHRPDSHTFSYSPWIVAHTDTHSLTHSLTPLQCVKRIHHHHHFSFSYRPTLYLWIKINVYTNYLFLSLSRLPSIAVGHTILLLSTRFKIN